MRTKFSVFIAVAFFLVLKLVEPGNAEPALLGAVGVAACGSMIFLGRFWTDYILPFGFRESFASDAGDSARSGPAIAFLGWILLGLMGWSILSGGS